MSHFDPGKRMQDLKRKFVDQASQRSAIPHDVAERIWEMMAAFAGYGFPKAHAASYAKLGWRSAWCKSHYPAEFMGAVLANGGGYYSQRVYLGEARRLGLRVEPPHVNYSSQNFTVRERKDTEERALFMGLGQVKDLTYATIRRIVQHAPFTSLEDFLTRVDPREAEAQSLARVGALNGLGTIPSILRRLQDGGWQQNQLSLFDWADPHADEDWTLQQKVDAQAELLGVSVSAHPLELISEKLAGTDVITTVDAVARVGRRVTVAGVQQASHRSRTARGEMLFLSFEDLQGTLDAILFPEVYRRSRAMISSTKPFLLTGVMEMDTDRGEPFLRVENVEPVK
jgi:DNA polymerase III alpha subunit